MIDGSRSIRPCGFQKAGRPEATPVTDECACFAVASPAKFSFVIKKTINLKHKIHPLNYLPNTCRQGVAVWAARITAT